VIKRLFGPFIFIFISQANATEVAKCSVMEINGSAGEIDLVGALPDKSAFFLQGRAGIEANSRNFLTKLDSQSRIVWSHSLAGKEPIVLSTAATSPAGYLFSLGVIGDLKSRRPFIANISPDGTLTWAKSLGSADSARSNGVATAITILSDGSVVLGERSGFSDAPRGPGFQLDAISATGGLNWSNQIWIRDQTPEVTTISAMDDGFVLLADIRRLRIPDMPLLVAAFRRNGDLLWAKLLGVKGFELWPVSLAVKKNGAIILQAAAMGAGAEGKDMALLSLSSAGDVLHGTVFDGGPIDRFENLEADENGIVAVGTIARGGNTIEDGVGKDEGAILRLTNSDVPEWSETLDTVGYESTISGLLPTHDGYLALGFRDQPISYFLASLDAKGQLPSPGQMKTLPLIVHSSPIEILSAPAPLRLEHTRAEVRDADISIQSGEFALVPSCSPGDH
jgi:hypothetical protein